jgi:hypothetical protein
MQVILPPLRLIYTGTEVPWWKPQPPIAGDILYYQCRGHRIRDLINARIEECGGSVVLLAHSLGGVACVDLLLDPTRAHILDRVPLLITIGSQAPYFYEIGALHSLLYEDGSREVKKAFAKFPKWLNLHNRRDLLSYVGEDLFPGHVQDREVKSMIPFPQSHGAYFARPQTYAHIQEFLLSAFEKAK